MKTNFSMRFKNGKFCVRNNKVLNIIDDGTTQDFVFICIANHLIRSLKKLRWTLVLKKGCLRKRRTLKEVYEDYWEEIKHILDHFSRIYILSLALISASYSEHKQEMTDFGMKDCLILYSLRCEVFFYERDIDQRDQMIH